MGGGEGIEDAVASPTGRGWTFQAGLGLARPTIGSLNICRPQKCVAALASD